MSESKTHQRLVKILIEYVKKIVGPDMSCFIQSDMSDEYQLCPQTEEGFRPDVFYEYNGILILGEAKTSDDVSRKHSVEQYYSYLKKCSLYNGKAEYVMVVPWTEYAEANNIVKKIQKDLPGEYEIKILREII